MADTLRNESPATATADEGMLFDRYPGLHSFEADEVQQRLFFGREEESIDFVQRLRGNRLIVLYGKSGLGKTSLLQAGVFPRLREQDLLPLRVRLSGPKLSPMEDLERGVREEMARFQAQNSQIEMSGNATGTWWEFFKGNTFWSGDRLLTPVLILDQFEEIFTLHNQKSRAAIAEELSHLVNGTVPPAMMARIREGNTPYDESPPELRVVLSLRIEYVGQLQELFPQIPSILSRRFILTPLGREEACRAIEEPAQVSGAQFRTRPFSYDPNSRDSLLDYLADSDSGAIEPYQLQLQCQEIERKVRARQSESPDPVVVDEEMLGGRAKLDEVVRAFYLGSMEVLQEEATAREKETGKPKWLATRRARGIRKNARELCEFGLLSDQGHRIQLTEEQIVDGYGLTARDLEYLVTRRLLRRERRLKSFTYELAHDSLAKPIFDSRPYRLSARARRLARVGLVTGLLAIAAFAGLAYFFSEAKKQALEERLKAIEFAGSEARVSYATTNVAQKRIEDLDARNQELLAELERTREDLQLAIDKNAQFANALDDARKRATSPEELEASLSIVQQDIETAQRRLVEREQEAKQREATLSRASGIPVPLMLDIHPGCFEMGSKTGENDESPVHEVCIKKPYRIGKYEVTFAEYDVFAVETGRKLPDDEAWGRDNRPVINVSWNDAIAYAEWLSEQAKSRKQYRLPTESEWEYAARAGTQTRWSFGDDESRLGDYAWYSENSDGRTYEVGKKNPNSFDLYDLHGNAWEWVEDCWHDNYEGAPEDGSAWLEANDGDCARRVIRGGSWFDEPWILRSAIRFRNTADTRNNDIGFRLAQDK